MRKIFAGCLILISCSPLYHFKKVATTRPITPQQKAIIAPTFHELFPVVPITNIIERVTVDTVNDPAAILQYNTIIDSLLLREGLKQSTIDSFKAVGVKYLPGKEIRTHTHTETVKTIPDAAQVYSLTQNLQACETTNKALQTEIDLQKDKIAELKKDKNYWLWWLIPLIALNVIFILWKVFK